MFEKNVNHKKKLFPKNQKTLKIFFFFFAQTKKCHSLSFAN